MIRSRATVDVPLSIEEAWRRYTDLDFIKKVDKKLKSTRLISGPVQLGLGRKTELSYEFRGKPYLIIQDIIGFEPPYKLVATSNAYNLFAHTVIEFERIGDSSTRITSVQKFKNKGLLLRILTPLVLSSANRQFLSFYETFARELTGLPNGPFHVQCRTTWFGLTNWMIQVIVAIISGLIVFALMQTI